MKLKVLKIYRKRKHLSVELCFSPVDQDVAGRDKAMMNEATRNKVWRKFTLIFIISLETLEIYVKWYLNSFSRNLYQILYLYFPSVETLDGWEREVLPHGDGRRPARQVSLCQLDADARKPDAFSFVPHQKVALSFVVLCQEVAAGQGGGGLCEARVKMQGKPEEEQMRAIQDSSTVA